MVGDKIFKVLGSGEESGFCIDNDFMEGVDVKLRQAGLDWNAEDRAAVACACIAVFMERYEVKEQ